MRYELSNFLLFGEALRNIRISAKGQALYLEPESALEVAECTASVQRVQCDGLNACRQLAVALFIV
eukprot:1758795-Rhodomonas_salina.2